jgi:hypothetical protein
VTVYCAICGEPVNPDGDATWQRCQSWTRVAGLRASGAHGGRDYKGTRALQEWAHGWHTPLELQQGRATPRQASLSDEAAADEAWEASRG